MKSVLLLDDDKDLCILMQSIFEELAVEHSVCVNSFSQLQTLDLNKQNFNLAFLDVNLGTGAETGLDAYDWLKENGFQGKTIFFTGHARNYPLLQAKLEEQNVDILEKPAELAAIEKILSSKI